MKLYIPIDLIDKACYTDISETRGVSRAVGQFQNIGGDDHTQRGRLDGVTFKIAVDGLLQANRTVLGIIGNEIVQIQKAKLRKNEIIYLIEGGGSEGKVAAPIQIIQNICQW